MDYDMWDWEEELIEEMEFSANGCIENEEGLFYV